jgi:hypothetical protein
MEQELRTWKHHYNICNAAYLALQDLLWRYELSTAHVMPPAHQEPNLRDYIANGNQSVATQPPIIAPIADLFSDFATSGQVQPNDLATQNGPTMTGRIGLRPTPNNILQRHAPPMSNIWGPDPMSIPQFDYTARQYANTWGIDSLEGRGTVSVPVDRVDDLGANAATGNFPQDRSGFRELMLDTDVELPLEGTSIASPHAQRSLIHINLATTSRESLSNDDSETASRVKRGLPSGSTLGHVSKRLKDSAACARCWYGKKKVRSAGSCKAKLDGASLTDCSVKGQTSVAKHVRITTCHLRSVFESALRVQQCSTNVR